ncbi:MAG: hypothetical protein HY280_11215 [Nitrospinae bacterium]|nr:hypothetical protein [Nitrospinota bacterium]
MIKSGKIQPGNVTTYTHTGRTTGTRYYYVITAVNGSGQESVASQIVSGVAQ